MFCRLVQCVVQMIQTNQCTIQKEVKKRQFCNILLCYNLARTTLQIGWGAGRHLVHHPRDHVVRHSSRVLVENLVAKASGFPTVEIFFIKKKHLNVVRKIVTHQYLLQITCGVRIFIYCKPAQNDITIMLLNKNREIYNVE